MNPTQTLNPSQVSSSVSQMGLGRPASPAPLAAVDVQSAVSQLRSKGIGNLMSADTKSSWQAFDSKSGAGTTPTVAADPNVEIKADVSDVGGEISGLGKDLSTRADNISKVFGSAMDGKKSLGDVLVGGAKIAAQATGGIADTFKRGFSALTDLISNDPQLQEVARGKGVGEVLDYVKNALDEARTEQAAPNPSRDRIVAWANEHPHVTSFVNDLADTGLNLSMIAGGDEAPTVMKDIASETKGILPESAPMNPPDGGAPPSTPSPSAPKTPSPGILENVQSYMSKKNVEPNLGSAVDNLNGSVQGESPSITGPDGKLTRPTATMTDPLKTYDDLYSQEQAFKGDIKQDTALGKVGEKIGDAYDKVASMRRAAGEEMASEMQKFGGEKTDISSAFPKLETDLMKSGAVYDAEKGGLARTSTSKLTSQDREMLNTYVEGLNRLGPNPTAAELDAFLSRTPAELDVYKGSNNITKVTNGERMIKANLAELRKSLTAEANPKFAGYEKAKSDYSTLSRFLDDGASFLGEKTASGDYAKDASLAKSSVQSILNGGRKDWLIKLEALTGYHALDESMLAIQAMKDAGNFRGQSLLDLLTPKNATSIPTSPKGLLERGANAAFEIGREKIAGTPNEQTRRFIMDRMKSGKTATPSSFPAE